MQHELPPLPYPDHALAPVLSAETFAYHYGNHHRAYVDKLNELTRAPSLADIPLDQLVRGQTGVLFNQAAQVWNHTFYWHCMTPDRIDVPSALAQAVERDLGSWARFEEAFKRAAVGLFGSGWAWLVRSASGKLEILTTDNADNPLRSGATPLLTCDVWEHAYYIDYRNERKRYVEAWWSVVDWQFVARQLG
jgi:Fe-Mn family superoxide dismutase